MDKNNIFCNLINCKCERSFINIKKVLMNSKEVKKDDLFVAIRGGNKFAGEALEKGAYVIYDDENLQIEEKFKKKAFHVKDSVEFLQEFAEKWRKNLNLKVIGITGSNGKTTVKDMIYHLLSVKYKGKKTEGNYNNHIGLPFTLLRAEEDDKFIILEMGMSGFGEIDLLGQIALPDINVITNIGESHLEFLKTKENVFLAKTEIIPYIKNTLVINGKICQSTVERNYKTNVLGEHNVLNLVMAIAVAKQFGMEDKIISEAVKNIGLTGMRFQIIENGDTTYINDAYNASPMSMEKSLETFSQIYNDRLKIMVLGDMLELGENELELHSNLFNTIKTTKFDKLYLFGERMKSLFEKIKENVDNENLKNKEFGHFDEKEEIKEKIRQISEQKVVLLKASRGMRLEEIIEK